MAIQWSGYSQGIRVGIDVIGGSGSRTMIAYVENSPGYRQQFNGSMSFGGSWSGSKGYAMFTEGAVKTIEVFRHTASFTGSRTYSVSTQVPYGAFSTVSKSVSVTVSASEVLPPAPTGVTATRSGDKEFTVRWSYSGAPTGFRIHRSVNGGAFAQVAQIGVNTKWTDLNTALGTNYAYRVYAFNASGQSGASNTTPAQWTIPIAPGAPTVKRATDTKIDLNWSRNSNYTAVKIYRKANNEATFTHVGTATGNAYAWSDTSARPNSRYWYQVRGVNPAGDSTLSASSEVVYTTPAPPTNLVAARTGNDIILSADTGGLYGTRFTVFGADGAQLATNVALPYTLTNANPGGEYKFQLVTELYKLRSARSGWSNTVRVTAPPAAPTVLEPEGVASVGFNRISWRHNPVDASRQTYREIQRRLLGASTWTTYAQPTASESQQLSFQAGVWELRVRTKGAHADWSPYSAVHTFEVINRPEVRLNNPTVGAVLDKSRLVLDWDFVQAQSKPQTAFQVIVYNNGVLEYDSGEVISDTNSYTVPSLVLENQTDYLVAVNAWHEGVSLDVNSSANTATFRVEFTPPTVPTVQGQWEDTVGANIITVSSSDVNTHYFRIIATDPDGSQRVIIEEVERSDGTPIEIYDYEATSNGETVYSVFAVSGEGLEVGKDFTVIADSLSAWLSAGQGTHRSVRLSFNPEVTDEAGRQRSTVIFAGRSLPVAYSSPHITRVLNLSGAIIVDDELNDNPQKVRQVFQDPAPVFLWRDPDGRRVSGVVSNVSLKRDTKDLYSWSFTLTETSK